MTMTRENPTIESTDAFWQNHPDPTQAAVHLALQWLAYVYPASEMQIDRTLKSALPYADTDLSSRWSQYLDEQDVEQHVQALEWMTEHLSPEQIPFLVETCWRLLLVDHELPAHVPLALRILGQVLKIDEQHLLELGELVNREYVDAEPERNRAPLLPLDPRYLDRIEWRLYGHAIPQRRADVREVPKSRSGVIGFAWGTLFGGVLVVALVFGPLQLGRIKVPVMSHQYLPADITSAVPSVKTEPAPSNNANTVADTNNAVHAELAAVAEPEVEVAEVPAAESVAGPVLAEAEASVVEPEFSKTEANPEAAAVVTANADRVLMSVTASILNVRERADVNSEIVIKLAGGAKVWAYPERAEGLWMFVRVEDVEGYASARFLAE